MKVLFCTMAGVSLALTSIPALADDCTGIVQSVTVAPEGDL